MSAICSSANRNTKGWFIYSISLTRPGSSLSCFSEVLDRFIPNQMEVLQNNGCLRVQHINKHVWDKCVISQKWAVEVQGDVTQWPDVSQCSRLIPANRQIIEKHQNELMLELHWMSEKTCWYTFRKTWKHMYNICINIWVCLLYDIGSYWIVRYNLTKKNKTKQNFCCMW